LLPQVSRQQFVEGDNFDGTLLHPLNDCLGGCSSRGICKVRQGHGDTS
jgi:hypothetical protein